MLFTLSPQSISIEASIAFTLNAAGSPASCPADLTGDGVLNFFDVSAFLSAYTTMDPHDGSDPLAGAGIDSRHRKSKTSKRPLMTPPTPRIRAWSGFPSVADGPRDGQDR